MAILTMNSGFFLIFFAAIGLIYRDLAAAAEDRHENCKAWAEAGECDANPGWMLGTWRRVTRVVWADPAGATFKISPDWPLFAMCNESHAPT